MRNDRKHNAAEEKVAILRRNLLDKVPIPDIVRKIDYNRLSSIANRKRF
jgi:hypothetical protein